MKRQIIYIIFGQLILLFAWELIARSGVAGLTVPTLSSVAGVYLEPRFAALLYRSAMATGGSALAGLTAGVLLGVTTAFIAHLAPPLKPGVDRLAVTINAVPAVAIAPIFILMVSRDITPILLATIAVFFLIYVAVSSGLRAASKTLVEMMSTFGGQRWQVLRYLEIPSAIPSLLAGLKISITAAMIGAVVGEWFGAPTGLGIVILNSMQNFQIPLMWAAILAVAAISLGAYSVAHVAERFVSKRFS
jgi:NitT/TauT family transport system permease protein